MRLMPVLGLLLASCGSAATGTPIERACAIYLACGAPFSPPPMEGFDQCVARWSQPTDLVPADLPDCVGRAGLDCAAVQRCFTARGPCPSPTFDACNGDTLEVCEEGALLALDCTLSGLRCIRGACLTPCGPDGPTCLGSQFGICQSGAAQVLTCPADATCSTALQCVGNGAVCGDPGAPRSSGTCDGNVAVNCLGGREARQDCATSGLTCQVVGEGGMFQPALCLPSCYDIPPACDGATVVYCGATTLERFDCAAAGFKGCQDRRCTL